MLEIKQYLDRVGMSKIEKPSLKFLAELQNSHLLAIPFEDLDIPKRARIILDPDRIYKKIIPTKRGGFCYELNGLFHRLLVQLGFYVDMLSARVYNHDKQELGPEFDHMTLLVHLDRDFLVDVGFGDSFRKPIQMPDGECRDVSGHYRIVNTGDIGFELQRQEDNGWKLQYGFTTQPRVLKDFDEMCNFQQDDQSSHFRMRNACTVATQSGRVTLSDSSLTVTENGKRTKTEFTDEHEFFALLKKHFGIEMEPL